jgi:hypothetical protein
MFNHTPGRQPVNFAEQLRDPVPARGATLYAKALANRRMPRFAAQLGLDAFLQPFIAVQKIAYWSAPGNATTNLVALGAGSLTTAGTATTRNVAATNILTRCRRLGLVSAASAGSATGTRQPAAQWTVGDGTGLGGFFFAAIFNISDASIVTAGRTFVGLQSATGAPSDVEPSTLTNCLGVGADSSHTNLHMIYGGSSAQAPISLGANFPCDTTNTDLYRICLYAPPYEAGVVYYELLRMNTGDVATGRLFGVPSTQIPSPSTFLTPNFYRSNGGVATAVGLDVSAIYIETDQ